jgi:hypothetical protein
MDFKLFAFSFKHQISGLISFFGLESFENFSLGFQHITHANYSLDELDFSIDLNFFS